MEKFITGLDGMTVQSCDWCRLKTVKIVSDVRDLHLLEVDLKTNFLYINFYLLKNIFGLVNCVASTCVVVSIHECIYSNCRITCMSPRSNSKTVNVVKECYTKNALNKLEEDKRCQYVTRKNTRCR